MLCNTDVHALNFPNLSVVNIPVVSIVQRLPVAHTVDYSSSV